YICEPPEAPALSPSVTALVARVNNIDPDSLRLERAPDRRLMSRSNSDRNFRLGNRILFILKDMTGISAYKAHKSFNNNWKAFREDAKSKNAAKAIKDAVNAAENEK
ncbi:MAG: hypothetical protein K2F79_05215, partial [Muribaculaceae bacterium]|nr:hypothetical protein [Muribaculaceae bacterium]